MPQAEHPAEFELAELGNAIEIISGQRPTPETMARFSQYLSLLERWNRTHRLTGYKSAGAIVRQLFLDGVLFLARVPPETGSIVDLGTGPGIPGVPIGIVRREISVTLVESKRKNVSFLKALKRELDRPDLEILEGRAEHLISERPNVREAFDVVVTRAVGAELIPVAAKYLKPGGLLLAGAPPAPPKDLDMLSRGGLHVSWERIVTTGLGFSRALLVAKKAA